MRQSAPQSGKSRLIEWTHACLSLIVGGDLSPYEDPMTDNQAVSFTQMKDGSKDNYMLIHKLEKPYLGLTADRILDELRRQGEATLEGYKITRLVHGLQSATRAMRDGADFDWIVGTLLHNIGDGLAPQNYDHFSAEVIRPFVRWDVAWVVEHHEIFQMLYYGRHYGWDENARD